MQPPDAENDPDDYPDDPTLVMMAIKIQNSQRSISVEESGRAEFRSENQFRYLPSLFSG